MARYAICPDDAVISNYDPYPVPQCVKGGVVAWEYVEVPTYAITKDFFDVFWPFAMWCLVFAFGVKMSRKILGT